MYITVGKKNCQMKTQTISKLVTSILILQQYALINTIQPTKPMTNEQAIAVLSEAGWGESLHGEALAIMQCESELIPTARGDYWGERPQALGLFQIHWEYYDEWDCKDVLSGQFIGYGAYYQCGIGFDGNPYDAVSNATVARYIYERSNNWAMWSCSND